MESFLWQSALLMLVAYFLGAVIGCLMRRLFTSSPPADLTTPGRLSDEPSAATPAAATAIRSAPEPVQPKIETVAQPTPPQEAKIAESARFERVLTSAPGARQGEPDAAAASAGGTTTEEQAAADNAAAVAAAATAAPRPPEPRPAPPQEARYPSAGGSGGPAAVVAPIATATPDDLREIGDIDEKTASLLNALGYTRFSDIAAWTADDARKVRGALGDRAAGEGWIEQAKILADGKDTERQRRRAGKGRENDWLGLPPSNQTGIAAPTAPIADAKADDLRRISGIDAAMQERLYSNGITTYSQIANWTGADVQKVNALLGRSRNVSRQNWIDQAKQLLDGNDAGDVSELASIAPVIASAPSRAAPAAKPDEPATKSDEPAADTSAVAAAPQQAASRTSEDDLLKIKGIDAATRDRLTGNGITSYAQVAKWTADDAQKIATLVGETGRASRQNWIEQAKVLSDGKLTAFAKRRGKVPLAATPPVSLPTPEKLPSASRPSSDSGSTATGSETTEASPAPPSQPAPSAQQPAADEAAAPHPQRLADAIRQNSAKMSGSGVSGMRSVRSQLLSGETSHPAGEVDDLKKIRGIGVLIEKKLNALGVYSYEQVANWSASEIERISNSLDFKGRIERERWVEQARILASGGQTEFSKRTP